MSTNTQVISALQFSGQVPPDQECNIGNLTAILQGAVNFLQVVTNQAQVNDGSGSSNSIAQQALQVANLALSTAQAAVAAQPPRRTSGATNLIAVPTGDSIMPLTWTPDMPNTNYECRVTFYSPNTAHPSAYYGFRVVDSSRTVGGCQILLDNMPAGTLISFVVEAL